MPVLRSTVLVDAPPRTVAGLLRDFEVTGKALRRCGHGLELPFRLRSPGDEIRVGVRVVRGLSVPLRVVVEEVSESRVSAVLSAGPLRHLAHVATLTPTGAGTLVLDEIGWTCPLGPLGRVADVVLLRRLLLRVLAARAEVLVENAAGLVAGPVVVATALSRQGRLLVAQRTRPPALAGRWELPGGRVEAGESEPDAVARECREELDVAVEVTGRLGTDLPIDAGVLRVHTAELAVGAQEPRALEHRELRWVGADELAGVDWVDADRAVLPDLVELLRSAGHRALPG